MKVPSLCQGAGSVASQRAASRGQHESVVSRDRASFVKITNGPNSGRRPVRMELLAAKCQRWVGMRTSSAFAERPCRHCGPLPGPAQSASTWTLALLELRTGATYDVRPLNGRVPAAASTGVG